MELKLSWRVDVVLGITMPRRCSASVAIASADERRPRQHSPRGQVDCHVGLLHLGETSRRRTHAGECFVIDMEKLIVPYSWRSRQRPDPETELEP